ncbi:hypothetical protein CDG81_08320 [Actinopolyspora erythraea]|uniref:Membrane protein n=1 Tax=Actinopolyspora erythraea TaxID=414996 RepID=A0A099D733_9ACTN|nr:M50 family metallopeptidase [Actinopolyspora erythraea]ASU78291.1 hypothetical protein CDG81_08320 [Actinopolyspora erythraea]KGI81741.1 membrane protein [Actinopolyspora erythraea]
MEEVVRSVPDFVGALPASVVALVALALIVYRASWGVLRNVVTIAHEGGHALVALLSGRRLNGIRLHSDTSGLTVSTGPSRGPGMVLTLFAGYPAVSLLGLVAAWLVSVDRVTLLLRASVVALALLLVALRNLYGLLSVLLTGAALFAVSWWADPEIRLLCARLLGWFLLLGGVRPLFELSGKRRRGRAGDSDADQLARLTGAPAPLWMSLWLLIALGALVLGANWLLASPFRFW